MRFFANIDFIFKKGTCYIIFYTHYYPWPPKYDDQGSLSVYKFSIWNVLWSLQLRSYNVSIRYGQIFGMELFRWFYTCHKNSAKKMM